MFEGKGQETEFDSSGSSLAVRQTQHDVGVCVSGTNNTHTESKPSVSLVIHSAASHRRLQRIYYQFALFDSGSMSSMSIMTCLQEVVV